MRILLAVLMSLFFVSTAQAQSKATAAMVCLDESLILKIANTDVKDVEMAGKMLQFALQRGFCVAMSAPVPVNIDEALYTYKSARGGERGVYKLTGQPLWIILPRKPDSGA